MKFNFFCCKLWIWIFCLNMMTEKIKTQTKDFSANEFSMQSVKSVPDNVQPVLCTQSSFFHNYLKRESIVFNRWMSFCVFFVYKLCISCAPWNLFRYNKPCVNKTLLEQYVWWFSCFLFVFYTFNVYLLRHIVFNFWNRLQMNCFTTSKWRIGKNPRA